MNNNDFKIFIPDITISKAKNSKGKDVMIVEGVASTMQEDTDGEILDPNGFDLEYLMQNGFINWHHATKENPGAIIGEPTKAWVKDNKLHIRAELYDWSPVAQDVYAIAKGLEGSSSKRRLGWSIEGKVMQKDSINPKFIRKSKVTGCAITPMPKNMGTSLNIVKGDYNLEMEPYDILGQSTILDIQKSNGEKLIVDRYFNIKHFNNGLWLSQEEQESIITITKGYELGMIDEADFNKIKLRLKENFKTS